MPIAPTDAMIERARAAIPELPAARAERCERDRGVSADQAKLLAFRAELGDFFERAVAAAGDGGDAKAIANWTCNDLMAALARRPGAGRREGRPRRRSPRWSAWSAPRRSPDRPRGRCSPSSSPRAASPRRSSPRPASAAPTTASSAAIVDRAMADQADAVEKVRAGNDKAIGAIIGAVMRETKGRADGGEVQRLIRERL